MALWRAGSVNFDLQEDVEGRLWISNADYNNTVVGEFNFPAVGIADHRITVASPLGPGDPVPTAEPPSIDLNEDLVAGPAGQQLRNAGYACALPNEMAFSSDFSTLYVGCYDTHNVAVVAVGPSPARSAIPWPGSPAP